MKVKESTLVMSLSLRNLFKYNMNFILFMIISITKLLTLFPHIVESTIPSSFFLVHPTRNEGKKWPREN